MKIFNKLVLPLAAIIGLFSVACNSTKKSTEGEVKLENLTDSASFAIGNNFASNLKEQDLNLNPEALIAGIKEVLNDGDSASFTPEEAQRIIMKKISADNKKLGTDFLAENAKNDSVKTTESGLQYIVVKEGTGASPGPGDQVTVHYTGKLVNGRVFDSSRERGEPASFPVSGVIPGWTEALQMMKEGGQWKIFIPSDLAYGAMGTRGIGPNQVLIFDVELIKVNKQEQPKGSPFGNPEQQKMQKK